MDDDDQWVGTGYQFLSKDERKEMYKIDGTKASLDLWTGLQSVLVECVSIGMNSMGYKIFEDHGTTKLKVENFDDISIEIPRFGVPLSISIEEVVDRVTRISPYLKRRCFDVREEAGGMYSEKINEHMYTLETMLWKPYASSGRKFYHDGLLRLQGEILGNIQKVIADTTVEKGALEEAMGNPSEFYKKIVGWNITAEEICRVLALSSPSILQPEKTPDMPTSEQVRRHNEELRLIDGRPPTGIQKVMKDFLGSE